MVVEEEDEIVVERVGERCLQEEQKGSAAMTFPPVASARHGLVIPQLSDGSCAPSTFRGHNKLGYLLMNPC